MAPKRRISQVSAPTMPTAAKKRTTRSGADAEATPSRNGTGLNGDYWTPTVRGGTTGQVWYASTDENEDSEPELAIVPARTRQPAKPKVDGASPSKALARVSSPTNTNTPVQSSSRFDAHPSVQPMDPSASEDNEPAQLHADGSHFDEPPASEAESFDDDGEDLLPSPPVSPSKRGRKGPNSGKASSSKPFTKSDISSHRQVRPKTKLATSESDEAPLLTPSSLPKTSFPSTSTSVLDNGALPALGQYPASPGKRDVSPSRLPRPLPSHLVAHFRAQKSVVFRVLRDPSVLPVADNHDSKNPDTRQLAAKQLRALLKGTTERGEGNSCMIIGPKGSGKTYMVEQLVSELRPAEVDRADPIVIRLSGHVQQNDRLAMREIVRQLVQQTDMVTSDLPDVDGDEEEAPGGLIADADENPFLDHEKEGPSGIGTPVRLPPTAHLPSLISTLPTLGRPVIIILDAFDLFALHARQALLYCLLDTVQHSQAATLGANYQAADASPSKAKSKAKSEQTINWSGLAVIGVTTRIDTLELLEKRVKSRFSGRIMRTAGLAKWEDWADMIRNILLASVNYGNQEAQWDCLWESAVERFITSADVKETFMESISLVKDLSLVSRILSALALSLSKEQPWPTVDLLKQATALQRRPLRFSNLASLHYPAVCLLISATHARTAGHEQVTFEQLYNDFRDQVRKSTAAPVQMAGGSIGMVRCSRSVLMGAFEQLVATRIFVPAGASAGSASLSREFIKYRCLPDRQDVKQAVDKIGQTNLKKWFGKAT